MLFPFIITLFNDAVNNCYLYTIERPEDSVSYDLKGGGRCLVEGTEPIFEVIN
jgi:hypothetical protein